MNLLSLRVPKAYTIFVLVCLVFIFILFYINYGNNKSHLNGSSRIEKFADENNGFLQILRNPHCDCSISDEFNMFLNKINVGRGVQKSGGLFFDKGFGIIDQTKPEILWKRYNLGGVIPAVSPISTHGGGVKRVFHFNNDFFGIFTLSSSGCYFVSLINLDRKAEIFRTPCIRENQEMLDFNGMGLGITELDGNFLLALGTPSTINHASAALAQDKKSPFGKILVFTPEMMRRNDSGGYIVHSSGFRNPEGLVNINGRLYEAEHGPRGGDEINFVVKGGNYGWPIFSLGSSYDGFPYQVTNSANKKFRSPMYSFIPSVGLGDLTSCPIKVQQRYKSYDCILAASLRGQSIFFILAYPYAHNVVSTQRVDVGMRVRHFFRQLNGDVYFSVDDLFLSEGGSNHGVGVFKIEVRD